MKNRYINIVIVLIALALSYLLGRFTARNTIVYRQTKADTTVITVDTTTKAKEPEVIIKYKPKIVYLRDTTIKTKPFEFKIDTILKRDTVYVSYRFPQNIFDMTIKSKPDTIINKTIKISIPVDKKEKWWKTPAYILGSVAVGIIIGRAVK